jgi:hypothetical protein
VFELLLCKEEIPYLNEVGGANIIWVPHRSARYDIKRNGYHVAQDYLGVYVNNNVHFPKDVPFFGR